VNRCVGEKIAQTVTQFIVNTLFFSVLKRRRKYAYLIFTKNAESKQSPNVRKFAQSCHPVCVSEAKMALFAKDPKHSSRKILAAKKIGLLCLVQQNSSTRKLVDSISTRSTNIRG
jgi:hypothetical protein